MQGWNKINYWSVMRLEISQNFISFWKFLGKGRFLKKQLKDSLSLKTLEIRK